MGLVALAILIEKVLPGGEAFARALAVVLIGSGDLGRRRAGQRAGADAAGRDAGCRWRCGGMSWRIRGSVLRVLQLRCDLPVPSHRRRAGRALDARRLHGRALVADRGGRGRTPSTCPGSRSRWRSATATTSRARPGRGSCTSTRGRPTSSAQRWRRSSAGGLGGDAKAHFPWAWKESELVGVRPVAIDVDHTRRRQRLRIRDRVSVRIRDRYDGRRNGQLHHLRPRPRRRGARHRRARGRGRASCSSRTAASAATAPRSTTRARSVVAAVRVAGAAADTIRPR